MSDSKRSMALTPVISPTPRTPPLRASGRRRGSQGKKRGARDAGLERGWPASCMALRNMAHAASNGGDAMQMIRSMALGVIIALAALTQPAAAQDKVKVGVFPTASSLPYFVAIERGFFKEQNIEPETIRLIGGPPNIAAMISNQIEAAIVLVTIEAMNANLKKPGVAMYIGVHSQNKTYQMEQFVVRRGYSADSLKDLRGARIMSAPGPANVVAAKAILAKVGLGERDYTIDQLDMAQHVNAMTSGTFDAGYTLEPQASTMRKLGVARTLEAGVITKYILGDESGNAFAAGCAITSD